MTERYVIPLAPVTKKNSQTIAINRKTGKPFVLPSNHYKAYEQAAGYYLKAGTDAREYPVNVKCLFYMPTRRRVDLTNLLEAIDDVLTKYGVVPDDNSNFIAGHDGSRVLYDHDNPRTEITIEPLWQSEITFCHEVLNPKRVKLKEGEDAT